MWTFVVDNVCCVCLLVLVWRGGVWKCRLPLSCVTFGRTLPDHRLQKSTGEMLVSVGVVFVARFSPKLLCSNIIQNYICSKDNRFLKGPPQVYCIFQAGFCDSNTGVLFKRLEHSCNISEQNPRFFATVSTEGVCFVCRFNGVSFCDGAR